MSTNIFIWKNNEQHGPFPEEEVRKHLTTGTFSRHDMAWTERQGDWKPLAEVLGSGVLPPPPPRVRPEQGMTMMEKVKVTASEITAKAAVSAQLAQKQALRKKLELVDLKQSDHAMGVKAHKSGLVFPEDEAVRARLDDLKSKIEELQKPEPERESFADKAKTTATTAMHKAQVEKLKVEQHLAYLELGAKWRTTTEPIPPELASEISAARTIEEAIKALNTEIEVLGQGTYSWARHPLWALAIVLALAGLILGAKVLTGHRGQAKTVVVSPRIATFEGYNKAGWLRGFYKNEIGPLNADRQAILFYCNFFDQTIADLAPLLHDARLPQSIMQQVMHNTMGDGPLEEQGWRAFGNILKQITQPGGPQQMMNNAMAQDTLKDEAKQDAERLVTTEDAATVKQVYAGLRTFVADHGQTK